jgi:hypothetical protein
MFHPLYHERRFQSDIVRGKSSVAFDRQHNGQKKKDRRTDNTMDKRKRTEGQTTQWTKEKGVDLRILIITLISPKFSQRFHIQILTFFSRFHKSELDRADSSLECFILNTMDKRKRTEGQTTQWTKEKGQNDRQHNDQKKKNKMTNNDLQNITQTTKD